MNFAIFLEHFFIKHLRMEEAMTNRFIITVTVAKWIYSILKATFKFVLTEAVVRSCSSKLVLLKILQISPENICFGVSF